MSTLDSTRVKQMEHLQNLCESDGLNFQKLHRILEYEKIKKLFKPKSSIQEIIKREFEN